MFSELLNDGGREGVAMNHVSLPFKSGYLRRLVICPLDKMVTGKLQMDPDDINWAGGPVWELGFSGFTAILFVFSFVACMPLSAIY